MASPRNEPVVTAGPGGWAGWAWALAALLAVAVFIPGPLAYSNADEWRAHDFASGYLSTFARTIALDLADGRFRPVYWLIQGGFGAVAGSGTAFVALRLVFLAACVWLHVRIAERLGARTALAVLLALVLAWSRPALAIWMPGGPNEAFANPLALGCTLLLLRASTWRGVLAGAAVGLAAALAKENYGAWTASALGAYALVELLRARRGAAFWTAGVGAVAQLAPAAIALLAVRGWSSSYVAYAVTTIRAPPSVTALVAFDQNVLAVLLSLPALGAIGWRLARSRPSAWELDDVLVVAVLAGVATSTFALGLVMPRYHLPLGSALLLVAARALPSLGSLRRGHAAAVVLGAILIAANAAGGARAVVAARSGQAARRLDEGLRAELREALRRHGAARVAWYPDLVELPIGALKHIELEGIRGPVELRPCVQPRPDSAVMLDRIFRENSVAVERPSPVLASTSCPGVRGRPAERDCELVLPGLRGLWPRYSCRWRPNLSTVVYRP